MTNISAEFRDPATVKVKEHFCCVQYDGDPPKEGQYKRPTMTVELGTDEPTVYTVFRADAKYRLTFGKGLSAEQIDQLRAGIDARIIARQAGCACKIERLDYASGE